MRFPHPDLIVATMAMCLAVVLAGCGKRPTTTPDDGSLRTERPQPRESAGTRLAIKPSSRLAIKKVPTPAAKALDSPDSNVIFHDVHRDLGINFIYDRGDRGKLLMVESTGGGGGWIDFDRDGLTDLLLVQGGFADEPRADNPANQLWRNLGSAGFVQVAVAAGADNRGYGQGVAIADFDNDGFDDIYVSNVGSNGLYHNQGDGTFLEVTSQADIDSPRWSTSAAWGDLDADGNLDLFVCNYLIYDPFHPLPCPHDDGTPGVCHPEDLDAENNVCFRNLGDGTFRDVTAAWNLTGREQDSKSLGTAIMDLTGDGAADVLVANDTTSNFLFVNDGRGHFEERGVELGCAMSGEGAYQASMGIAVGDYDRNLFYDVYMTHFTQDSNTLYANLGAAGFHDTTRVVGLHQPTLPLLAFGTVMADFDCNGTQELFVTNGHVDAHLAAGGDYDMPPQLFTYAGDKWHDISRQAGPFFASRHVGRAVATSDFDNDGDLDLAVVHQGTPTAILENESVRKHWLKVSLVGTRSNRSAIGTTVRLLQGDTVQAQQLVGGSSYCASHEPVLIFGLGDRAAACTLEIVWPSGHIQRLPDVAVNQHVTCIEAGP